MKGKDFIYGVAFVLLVIGVMVFLHFSNKSYIDLLDTNDSLLEQLSANREESSKLESRWSDRYHSLESKYGVVLSENERLKSELEGVELPVYGYSEFEIKLLAVCVQCEAGENNKQAQKYIAQVVLNRVKSGKFKDTIEGVIYEKVGGDPQFSVAYDGTMDNCVLSPSVLANVYSVIVFGSDLPENVLYFYSAFLEEDNWVKNLNVYGTVEGTVFVYE